MLGICTITPVNQFVVNGAVGIGTANSSYVTTVAPAGGMIIQGNELNCTLAPGELLDVPGTVRFQEYGPCTVVLSSGSATSVTPNCSYGMYGF